MASKDKNPISTPTKISEEEAARLLSMSEEAKEEYLKQEKKIAELKVKYARPDSTGKKIPLSEVIVVKVGDKTAYLRKPDRAVLSMARQLGEGEYIRINELLLDGIWLEGDEEIRTDDDYFLNVIPYLEGLIAKKEVELKKS